MTLAFERGARVALLTLLLSSGVLVHAAPAHADEPEAQTRMAARELAVSGAESFEKQDFATALDRFQRAESLYKVPSISIMVARCLARLGRLVEAVDKYEETSRMPLEASAPEAFQRAVADAKAEVDGVSARVARLELRVPADVPTEARIMLDERPLPKALWGVPMPVNPGPHQVTAHAPGRETSRYDVNLAEGAQQSVEVALSPDSTPTSALAPSRPGPEPSGKQRVTMLPLALFAGSGVAVVFGAVTGAVALGKKSTLDERCDPGCPASLSSDLDSYRLTRALSYVGFGVGLVAAGAGTYLLLHESRSGAQVGALLQPGGAGIAGRF